MLIAVFTPTRRPGLDVAWHSVARQQLPAGTRVVWLLADDLHADRMPLVASLAALGTACPAEIRHWRQPTAPGMHGNLEAAYNAALRHARQLDADMLVSLQDYVWAPPDGLARFARLARRHPDAILTGLCDLSADPPATAVVRPDDPWTIFATPYADRPTAVAWPDCRRNAQAPLVRDVDPVFWEANWAAIPRAALHDERLAFDERLDGGFGYGNQAYAYAARSLGHRVVLDATNVAVGLPHKAYWPADDFTRGEMRVHNRRLVEETWRVRLAVEEEQN